MYFRLILTLMTLQLCLFGCSSKTDDEHTHSNEPMMPAPGDPSGQLFIEVKGIQLDGSTVALNAARIYVSEPSEVVLAHHHHHPEGDAHAVTNEAGAATLNVMPDRQYIIHIEADGYDGVARRAKQALDDERTLIVTLRAEQKKMVTIPESGSIEVKLGDTVGGSVEPVTLTIEAGDLSVEDGDGQAISGEVEITYGSWDPAVDDPSLMPSDLATAEGSLVSFGMFHVEFRQDGRTLNVRDGQTIAWSMKINDDLAAMAAYAQHAEALNIYGFDHATGLWVKEEVQRSFTPSTGIITTESTHFSHKNVDGPSDSFDANSCLNIRVVDEKGNQVNGADIRITGSGANRSRTGNGCEQLSCTMSADGEPQFNDMGERIGVIPDAFQIGYNVSATKRVFGNRSESDSTSVSTTCDDTNIRCGRNGCEDVTLTIPMCRIDGERCETRDQCCDQPNDLACRLVNGLNQPGECGQCVEAGGTCLSSEECCGALNCIDNQCFEN